jgi:hypothetical protein
VQVDHLTENRWARFCLTTQNLTLPHTAGPSSCSLRQTTMGRSWCQQGLTSSRALGGPGGQQTATLQQGHR